MIKGNCPICNGFTAVNYYDPYDGYHGDLGVYRVGCTNCRVYVEDKEQEKAEEKWNKICNITKPMIGVDFTSKCIERGLTYVFPCKAGGGCPYLGRCVKLTRKNGKTMVIGLEG